MDTIESIPFRRGPFTIAGVRYENAGAVPFRIWMRVLGAMIGEKLEKRRTRIHLSELDADGLEDIGLTVDQANREIRKSLPFFERHR
ncbi:MULTISPECIES: DUF1127 domain-containing protein [unclassified Roseitalea]|uniref:DUF1127 domain-containing protein n=1 Tax=unclassified Roseitalea TaxID=2639107 RepID=UPI0027401B1D|nr:MULTISPECIES: DUF1127 domain-containing protein [unclassified Roseitalea]